MYAQDVPVITAYGSSAKGLQDVITFALLSIRQPFRTLFEQMADVRRLGQDSRYLWGAKRKGFQDAKALSGTLVNLLERASVADAMFMVSEAITGLGMVKSGFVLQMLGHDVACIDSRNMAMLGFLPTDRPALMRLDDVGDKGRVMRIGRYLEFCRKAGGAEYLWDKWCEGYATELGLTPDQVSKMHVKIITRKG
jgi:hypothetical protein